LEKHAFLTGNAQTGAENAWIFMQLPDIGNDNLSHNRKDLLERGLLSNPLPMAGSR
jgi:hypothetical protein